LIRPQGWVRLKQFNFSFGAIAMATAKNKSAGDASKGIKVVSRPPIFRRAGREFTATPTIIALSDISLEHLEMIRAETNLVVVDVDIETAKNAD
jgi:hypothetical protein